MKTACVVSAFALVVTASAAFGQADWKKEWASTVEAAKKEGQLNIYIGGWGAVVESGAFQKAYPGIKVTFVGGGGRGDPQHILAQAPPGKNSPRLGSEGGRPH